MWVLEGNEASPGVVHYLPCGHDLLVSRRDGHILLTGDSSISRSHASLRLTHSVASLKKPAQVPSVKLTELGAKYGTFVNDGIQSDRKIPERSSVDLKNGDLIRFGMLANTWRLVHRGLVVTTSAVPPESKTVINQALLTLGGHCLTEWDPACSYLVMTGITLTVKVVYALALGRIIVTPKYLTALADAMVKRTQHPKPSDFQPPLLEEGIKGAQASFAPDERRSKVLSGKTFLFHSTRQFKRMGPAVILAGGKVEELSESNSHHLSASPPTHILIHPPPDKPSSSPLFIAASKLLEENNLATIPESDIGLSILFVQTSGCCNPAFRMASILKRSNSSASQRMESLKIYATETQDANSSAEMLTGTREVPETGQSTASRPSPSPRNAALPPPTPASSSRPVSSVTATSLLTSGSTTQVTQIQSHEKYMATNKRKRSAGESVESDNPVVKRSDRSQAKGNDLASNVEGEVKDLDLPESKFAPPHTSTQREDVENTTIGSESKTTLSTDTTGINVSSVERTIPMVPFTLPSLKTETLQHDEETTLRNEEEATQPCVPVKEEVVEENILDEIDFQPGKRRFGERTVRGEETLRGKRNRGLEDREAGGILDEEGMLMRREKRTGRHDDRAVEGDLDKENRLQGGKMGNRIPEGEEKGISSAGKRTRSEDRGAEDSSDAGIGWMVGGKRARQSEETVNERPTNPAGIEGKSGSSRDLPMIGTDGNVRQEKKDLFTHPVESSKRRLAAETAAELSAPDRNTVAQPFDALAAKCRRTELNTTTDEPPSQSVNNGQQSGVAEQGIVIKKSGSEDGESARVNTADITTQSVNCFSSSITQQDDDNAYEGFISKKTSANVTRSSIEQEKDGNRTEAAKKSRVVDGGVDDLGGRLEKSLVVVEVRSLILPMPLPPSPATTTTLISSGLINYKQFRKSHGEVICLPHIIGGDDLIANCDINKRREDWFKENAEVIRDKEESDGNKEMEKCFENNAPNTKSNLFSHVSGTRRWRV